MSKVEHQWPKSSLNPKYRRMPGEFMYKGNLWPSWTSEKMIRKVEDQFLFLPTDIILSGYPKSGITFLSEISCLLHFSHGKLECLQSAIEKVENCQVYFRVPFIEEEWTGLYPMMNNKVQAMEYLDCVREQQGGNQPRLIKTHLPFDSIECALNRMQRNLRPRILYVYRNPKDVAVSMYNFYCGLQNYGPFEGAWDEFFEMWIDGWIGGGDWRKVVPPWLKQAEIAEPTQMLAISYEQLVNDTEACVNNIHHFLLPETDLEPTVRQVILERTSFKKMRENKMTNYKDVEEFIPSFQFMRRGCVGDWKNWFSPEQNSRFMAAYKDTLEDLEQCAYSHAIRFE
ncbi:hypothetical protein CRM22_004271 [Opisthorchis felineus]|uniref:Sulfotransferase domain-containing protein n=1 Tax=Opisthorchis felineus TaxID=147828 RepID=A0A4S2LX02_OPIFE|nr:hypothetical protein CRM22_004271 [Opisthorchis felineus]